VLEWTDEMTPSYTQYIRHSGHICGDGQGLKCGQQGKRKVIAPVLF